MGQDSQNQGWLTRQLTEFANAWQQGIPPEIADFLPPISEADPAARRQTLHELILVDLKYRWRRPVNPTTTIAYQPSSVAPSNALPDRPRLDDYVRRYPELGPLDALPDELILCEFQLRKQFGDRPVIDEYREQFGPLRKSLWAALAETPATTETSDHHSAHDTQTSPLLRALKIRCPHCHNPVEILDDQAVTEITCPSCATVFGLVGQAGNQPGAATTPRRFGHFELIEQVGEGAFGAVWKSRDTQLDRIVAVKIPRRTQLDVHDVEQFVREARAAAQLKHPNIVSVHEVGREQETVYIVSDFIEGQSLDKWLAGQPQTPTEAAVLCRKIALALHHAHEAGVVHRDLKPSNIMIDAAGEPHVMDFGLAKREAGEITMTVEGQILGTPAYMSPEQAKGEGHKADRRSDVYSLGVILFELLTGERPFRGDLRMLLQQVIADEAPSPRRLNARIPKDLETITHKSLEKDANRRYATADELSQELTRFIEHKPIIARPIAHSERAWRWCKRNPAIAGLSAAVFAVLVTGIVVSISLLMVALTEKDRANAEKERANEESERVKSHEHFSSLRRIDTESSLYALQIACAQQALGSGDATLCRKYLDSCQRDIRGWEYHYIRSTLERNSLPASSGAEVIHAIQGDTSPVVSAALSPDGGRLISSLDRSIKVWDVATGKELLAIEEGHGQPSLSNPSVGFSRDGKQIIAASTTKLAVWDAGSGQIISWSEIAINDRGLICENPDGRRIVGELNREIKLSGSGYDIVCAAISRDGQSIARGYGNEGHQNSSLRLNLAGHGRERLLGSLLGVTSLAFSPDGKRLVSASMNGTLEIWDVDNGRYSSLALKGHGDYADGKVLKAIRAGSLEDCVNSLAFSPDGRRIISGSLDQSIKVWDAFSGHEMLTLKGHTSAVTCVGFSPDGKRIVSGSANGTIKIWDATLSADR